MQDHGFRIVRNRVAHRGIGLADDRRARDVRRQVRTRVLRPANHTQIEMFGPETGRRRRRRVPVVLGLVVGQHWPLARRVADPAARMVVQRHPGEEMRVAAEGIVLVVEEAVVLHPRRDQQVVEAPARERSIGTTQLFGQVRPVEFGKCHGDLARDSGPMTLLEVRCAAKRKT